MTVNDVQKAQLMLTTSMHVIVALAYMHVHAFAVSELLGHKTVFLNQQISMFPTKELICAQISHVNIVIAQG